jgi:hypothetical protein
MTLKLKDKAQYPTASSDMDWKYGTDKIAKWAHPAAARHGSAYTERVINHFIKEVLAKRLGPDDFQSRIKSWRVEVELDNLRSTHISWTGNSATYWSGMNDDAKIYLKYILIELDGGEYILYVARGDKVIRSIYYAEEIEDAYLNNINTRCRKVDYDKFIETYLDERNIKADFESAAKSVSFSWAFRNGKLDEEKRAELLEFFYDHFAKNKFGMMALEREINGRTPRIDPGREVFNEYQKWMRKRRLKGGTKN